MTKGWYGDRMQHGLASKGIKTVSGQYVRDKQYEKVTEFEPVSVQKLAKFYETFFYRKTRDDGEEFWLVKDDRPEELKELIHEAHGDMMPDDHRYEFILESLTALANYEDPDDAIEGIESDVYTSDLTSWLNSRNDRTYYLTEAIEEYGVKDGFDALSLAQYQEKSEVFWSVKNSLENTVEENDYKAGGILDTVISSMIPYFMKGMGEEEAKK